MLWLLILVAVAGLIGVSWLYTQFHIRRGRKRYPPEGDLLDVGGVRVHLKRYGQGNGRPVLCLHGLNGFLQDWTRTPIVEALAEDREVVALDRPGYGWSTRTRSELSDPRVQADWLVELMDELGWDEPALILGHSWGGALAMTLAVRHPDRVRGLVLLAPYLYPLTEPDDWFHRIPRLPFLRTLIGHAFLAPAMRLLGPRYISASFEPEPIPEGYHEMWLDMSAQPGHFDTTLEEVRTVDPALHDISQRYPEVAAPVTVVTGDSDVSVDPRLNARRLAEEPPHAELVWLEGVGHMVPWLHSGVVLEAVADVEARAKAEVEATEGTGAKGQGHP